MCLIKGLQVIAALVVHSSNTLFWFTRRIYLFFYFCLVRPALMAYGGSQARVWIGAAAACLHHSSQKCWILNPLSEARDRTWVLMDTSRVHYCWATIGTPHKAFLICVKVCCHSFIQRSRIWTWEICQFLLWALIFFHCKRTGLGKSQQIFVDHLHWPEWESNVLGTKLGMTFRYITYLTAKKKGRGPLLSLS